MRKTFLSFSSTSLESTLDVLWWSNFQDLSRSDWCFPGCQDLSGLRACEITVSRPFLGRRGEVIVGHKAADEISFFGPGCVVFFCFCWCCGWESRNTKHTYHITNNSWNPTSGHPRYLYEKLIYKDAIVAHPGVSMSGGLRSGYRSVNRLGPPDTTVLPGTSWSRAVFHAGPPRNYTVQQNYKKDIQRTRVFFPSWQDASPVWIHIDFLWDIALPPYHVPGPPRLGNVWFRLGETGHDQHLGVWYLVDFFCLESFDCWGLHSGQTGKFETLFVLAGGQVSFSYNKCVWGFWNRFFSWAAKLRHVRRSWLCWRSYLSHHLRQWCDGFSLGRIWMGGDVRCGL